MAAPVTTTIQLEIGDAMKQMVTHNAIHNALCYFWTYKCITPVINPNTEVPGPTIYVTQGDTINLSITNRLDEPHSLAIPGVWAGTGPIAPNATWTGSFQVPSDKSGSYLYYDNLNEPVNRMMGLHGAMCIMPDFTQSPPGGGANKWSPYHNPTANVQGIYNAFGDANIWPGLAWGEQGTNPAPYPVTPPFRSYHWVFHQASSKLFAEVGNYTAGQDYPAAQFIDKFMNGAFNVNPANSYNPEYFTINGQSGHYSHNNMYIMPQLRVGEPVVIHILNAGLSMHSAHIHANHFFVTSINHTVQTNPVWVDVFNIHPMDVVDYTWPYMRPPDIPNQRGIGRADTPLTSPGNPRIPGSVAHPTWPPNEELNFYIPNKFNTNTPGSPNGWGANAKDQAGNPVDLGVQLSPLCYPMHDHSEATQTAQGGNYNCGLIAGVNFCGDRNTAGGVTTFPNTEYYIPPNNPIEPAAEPHF